MAHQLEYFLSKEYGYGPMVEMQQTQKKNVMHNCFLEQLLWLIVNIGYQNKPAKIMFITLNVGSNILHLVKLHY